MGEGNVSTNFQYLVVCKNDKKWFRMVSDSKMKVKMGGNYGNECFG